MKNHQKFIYEKHFKRLLDIFVAILSLVVLSPVILILLCLIKVKIGSPIFYIQCRPGLHGKIFKLYKFRTMTDKKDKYGNYLPDSQRLTNFGRKIRAASLDELPEIFNILKGDMSFIGPRPLLVKYIPYFTSKENIRHNVRPGLTGLAQVSGRNNITKWEDRFELDILYVKNLTFKQDLQIFFKTVFEIFKQTGIGEVGNGDFIPFDEYRKSR